MSQLNIAALGNVDASKTVPVETVVAGSAKAWALFDGTVATPSITDSFNVSSITDNGVGDYTVNFTSALPSADYAVGGTANSGGGNAYAICPSARTTTSLQVYSFTSSTGIAADRIVHVIVFDN